METGLRKASWLAARISSLKGSIALVLGTYCFSQSLLLFSGSCTMEQISGALKLPAEGIAGHRPEVVGPVSERV